MGRVLGEESSPVRIFTRQLWSRNGETPYCEGDSAMRSVVRSITLSVGHRTQGRRQERKGEETDMRPCPCAEVRTELPVRLLTPHSYQREEQRLPRGACCLSTEM